MTYELSNGLVTDDVIWPTWPPKLLWGSTVGYPSDDSLASCYPRDAMLARVFARAT